VSAAPARVGVLERAVRDAVLVAGPRRHGRVRSVVGLQVEVEGLDAAIGDAMWIESTVGALPGEVIALRADACSCMVFGDLRGIRVGALAGVADHAPMVAIGNGLLGRVLDGLGRPIDGGPLPTDVENCSLEARVPHPLRRAHVDVALSLGIRALDTLVPCGRGQRLGLFAGSGVGKSTLLSMIARRTEAQVAVIALVGERGREVREFIERDLGPEGLARSVVVVATSDQPPLVRLRAAFVATTIAEWFRDRGNDVLLMMDSLTRFAMAQREVGLAAGEPPATRGYPPSTFGLLAGLLERAGAGEIGSITGLYTVLVEGDDLNEPVADHARSILDGHVMLTRRLATAGHFPSIDVLDSISRVTGAITTAAQRALATQLRQLLAASRDSRDLIEIGAYAAGSNPTVDRYLDLQDDIDAFLRQDPDDLSSASASWERLATLLNGSIDQGVGA